MLLLLQPNYALFNLAHIIYPLCTEITSIIITTPSLPLGTMAPHSSTLAWRIPWTEEPGRLQSMGSLRVRHDWETSLSLSCIGEGNGNPLQCSCLENPRDGGAWWEAVMGSHRVGHDWSDLAAAEYSEDKRGLPLLVRLFLHKNMCIFQELHNVRV